MFLFRASGKGYLGFCIIPGVEGISNVGERPWQCWDDVRTQLNSQSNPPPLFYLYISSKGLVSAKQLSQTSFTTLAASTSSLQFGLVDTDSAARRFTHS